MWNWLWGKKTRSLEEEIAELADKLINIGKSVKEDEEYFQRIRSATAKSSYVLLSLASVFALINYLWRPLLTSYQYFYLISALFILLLCLQLVRQYTFRRQQKIMLNSRGDFMKLKTAIREKATEVVNKLPYRQAVEILQRYAPDQLVELMAIPQRHTQQLAPVTSPAPSTGELRRRGSTKTGKDSPARLELQPQPAPRRRPSPLERLLSFGDSQSELDRPETQFALICQFCSKHNGLAMPGFAETKGSFLCAGCQRLNNIIKTAAPALRDHPRAKGSENLKLPRAGQ